MTATAPTTEPNTFTIQQETRVRASIETTFQALLDQLGPHFETPDGASLNTRIEAWPGGRWYRDLGNNTGHFWAHVQAIKRPSLLEFSGPLMMSFAAINNVQYRLKEENGETVIQFHHLAFGAMPDDRRAQMEGGWKLILDRVKAQAEKSGKK